MKKITSLLLSLLLVCTIVFGAFPVLAEENPGGNHYNVVLVVDGSGSMISTDSQNLRFEAINQFVGLLAQQGNTLGTIVFDEDIEVSMDLTPINNRSDKEEITKAIENYEVDPHGDTNIGLALDGAVDMIAAKGKQDLKSVIVLLSDGNTDLEGYQATQLSLSQKADAIDRARDKDIPVYTVCLNEDGSANANELKQIADATGGNFEEVSHPEDLKHVFQSFYNLICGTSTHSLIPSKVWDETGVLEGQFSVPSFGVQEVNIIISGNVSDIVLTSPDSSQISGAELQNMSTVSKSFTLIKVVDPVEGDWKIVLHGKEGKSVSADMVYNSDFRVEFSLLQQSDVPVNTAKTYTLTIFDGNQVVTDKHFYKDFIASLCVSDASGKLLDMVPMTPGKDAFSAEYSFDEIGTYYLSSGIDGQIFTYTTDPVMVNVGNTAPYLTKDGIITKKIYLFPFSNETSFEIDVSDMAEDGEGDSLTYRVVSTAFLADDYQMTPGGVLSMKDFSVSKGSFTIGAFDSMGAYCSFTVKVETVRIPLWLMVAIVIGELIAVLMAGFILSRVLRKPFKGSCFVQSMVDGEYSQWSEIKKLRGKIRLSDFGIELPQGISGSAYLQASGKHYVTLVSSTPFYCRGEMVHKMQITSFDVEIRASANSMDAMWIHFNRKGRLKSTQ